MKCIPRAKWLLWLGLIPCIAVVPLLTACWDYRDIDQRTFALMVGIDTAREGFHLSAQVTAPPTEATTTPGGLGAGGITTPPVRVIEARAPTLDEAFEGLNAITSRELDLHQLLLFVVGAEAARQGLDRLDWIVRFPSIQLAGFVAVSRTTALDIVSARTSAEPTSSAYIVNALEGVYTQAPEVVSVPIWASLANRRYNTVADVYLPAVATQPYGVNFAGIALFRDNRLVGWLDPREAALLNMVAEHHIQGEIAAQDPQLGRLVGSLDRGTVKTDIHFVDGRLTLVLDVTLVAQLYEAADEPHLTEDDVSRLEQAFAASTKTGLEQLLRKLQTLQVDPIGFGELLRRKRPDHPLLQDGETWHRAYAGANRDVRVHIKLKTRGRRK